jgi:Serine incorporator (Serinc)
VRIDPRLQPSSDMCRGHLAICPANCCVHQHACSCLACAAAWEHSGWSPFLKLSALPHIFPVGPSKGAAMQDYEPVSYNYSWFHFIFSLASMYIAMLMTGALATFVITCWVAHCPGMWSIVNRTAAV